MTDNLTESIGVTWTPQSTQALITFPAMTNSTGSPDYRWIQSTNSFGSGADPVSHNGVSMYIENASTTDSVTLALKIYRTNVNVYGYVVLRPGEGKRLLVDYREFGKSSATDFAYVWPSQFIVSPLNVFLKDSSTSSMIGRGYYRHELFLYGSQAGWTASQTDWKWQLYRRIEAGQTVPEVTVRLKSVDLNTFDYNFAIDEYGQYGTAWGSGDQTHVTSDQDLVDARDDDLTWLSSLSVSSIDGVDIPIGGNPAMPLYPDWTIVTDGDGKPFFNRRNRLETTSRVDTAMWMFGVSNVSAGYASTSTLADNMMSIFRQTRGGVTMDNTSWYTDDFTAWMKSRFGKNYGASSPTDTGYAHYESNLWRRFKQEYSISESGTYSVNDTAYNAKIDSDWMSDTRTRLEAAGVNTLSYGASIQAAAYCGAPSTNQGRPFVVGLSSNVFGPGQEFQITNYYPLTGLTGKQFPDLMHADYLSQLEAYFEARLRPYHGNALTFQAWMSNFVGFFYGGENHWANVAAVPDVSTATADEIRGKWILATPVMERETDGSTPYASKSFLLDQVVAQSGYGFSNFANYYCKKSGGTEVALADLNDAKENPIYIRQTLSKPSDWRTIYNRDLQLITAWLGWRWYKYTKDAFTATGMHGLLLGDMNLIEYTPQVVLDNQWSNVDVMSFNNYKTKAMTNWSFYDSQPKPVLIGEFSFPGSDCGASSGLRVNPYVEANDSADQGDLAYDFLEQAAKTDNIIGAIWFRYVDQPVGGRMSDGENSKFGLVSVTDQSRRGLLERFNDFANALYTSPVRPYTP